MKRKKKKTYQQKIKKSRQRKNTKGILKILKQAT
jgi:hypothetical protein